MFYSFYPQCAVHLEHLATKQLITKDKGQRGMITARGSQHRQIETAHKPVLSTFYLMKVMLHDVIDLHVNFWLLRRSESTPLDRVFKIIVLSRLSEIQWVYVQSPSVYPCKHDTMYTLYICRVKYTSAQS